MKKNYLDEHYESFKKKRNLNRIDPSEIYTETKKFNWWKVWNTIAGLCVASMAYQIIISFIK